VGGHCTVVTGEGIVRAALVASAAFLSPDRPTCTPIPAVRSEAPVAASSALLCVEDEGHGLTGAEPFYITHHVGRYGHTLFRRVS
jgi:hypothetical protein